MKKIIKSINIRKLIFSIIPGLFFSSSLVFGKQIEDTKELSINFGTILFILLLTIIFTIVFYKLLDFTKNTKNSEPLSKTKIFLALSTISLIILIAIYPGNVVYDTANQYTAYYYSSYSTHFPPLFCFILGVFLDLGFYLFNSYNAGVFLLLLMQLLLVNYVIAEVITYCSKKLKNKTFSVISTLYFILHPLSQMLILSTCHDTPFAALFALLVVETLKMIEDKTYFDKKTNYLKCFLLIFFICAIRNNGFFALLPAFTISAIIFKEHRIAFTLLFFTSLFTFQLYNNFFINKIAAHEGIHHESMNIPVVQIARTMYKNPNAVNYNELNKYFKSNCDWSKYEIYSGISDNYKLCFNDNYMNGHLLDFLNFWIKTGLEDPENYIEAAANLSHGLYYPYKKYPIFPLDKSDIFGFYTEYDVKDIRVYDGNKPMISVGRTPVIPLIDDFFQNLVGNQHWDKIPFFHIIWSGAFSSFLFIITLIFVLYKKKYIYAIPLSFIFGMLLTVFLAPVVIFRYLFPVVLTTPIMFYIIVKCVRNKSAIKKA